MFALANVVHFLTDKFARLSGGGFALPGIPAGPLQSFLFWHNSNALIHRLAGTGGFAAIHSAFGAFAGRSSAFRHQLRLGLKPIFLVVARDFAVLLKNGISASGDFLVRQVNFGI